MYPNDVFTVCLGRAWSDMASTMIDAAGTAHYSDTSFVHEKTLKTVLGNNVGGEFFNYIKPFADQTASGYVPARDANGNLIHGWDEDILDANGNITGSIFHEDPNAPGCKLEYISNAGDGINTDLLNLSNWQNRTTDYGRKFSIGTYEGTLVIHFTK